MITAYWRGNVDSDTRQKYNYSGLVDPPIPLEDAYTVDRFRVRILTPIVESEFPPPSVLATYDIARIRAWNTVDDLVFDQTYSPGDIELVEGTWEELPISSWTEVQRIELQPHAATGAGAARVQVEITYDTTASPVEWELVHDQQTGMSETGDQMIDLSHVSFVHDIRFDSPHMANPDFGGTALVDGFRVRSIDSQGVAMNFAVDNRWVLVAGLVLDSGSMSDLGGAEIYCNDYQVSIDMQGSSEWLVRFAQGVQSGGSISNSRIIDGQGFIDGGTDGGGNTGWVLVESLYWNNLNGTSDATDRTNYSVDPAGVTAATAGSLADDDLLVGAGSGAGAQDTWEVPAAASVVCESISFEGYTGTQTFPTDAEITAQTVTHLATDGNTSGFRGNLYVNQFLNIGRATPIAVTNFDDRLKLNFVGGNPKIQFVGSSSNAVTHNIDPWNILDDDTLEIESLVTGADNEVLVRGGANFAAPGGTIRKTGSGRFMHTSGNNSFSNVGQVLVEAGEYGLSQWSDNTSGTVGNSSSGKGIGPNPGDVPIILSEDTALALRCSSGGQSPLNWGVSLQVPSGSTGCRLRFAFDNLSSQRLGSGAAANQAQWEINEDFEVFLDTANAGRSAGLAVPPVLAPDLTFTFRYLPSTVGSRDPRVLLLWGSPSLAEVVTLLDSPGGNGLATLRCDDSDVLANVQQLTIGAGTYLRSSITSGNGGVRIGGDVDIHPDASIGMTFSGRAWTFERPNGVYNLLGRFRSGTNEVSNNAMQMLFVEDCQLNLRTESAVTAHDIWVGGGAAVVLNAGQARLSVLNVASGGALQLVADAVANPGTWDYSSGGVLDLNGFELTCPAFVHSSGQLTMGGGRLTVAGGIGLTGGTLDNPVGATFTCDTWLSSIDCVGTDVWEVNATTDARHTDGLLEFSHATGVYGLFEGGTYGDDNDNWVVAEGLWWHNGGGTANAADDRRNYTWDQAGTIVARPGSMAAYPLWFDGSGSGSGDPWVLGAGDTLDCQSVNFRTTGITVDVHHSATVNTDWVVIEDGSADYSAMSGTWNIATNGPVEYLSLSSQPSAFYTSRQVADLGSAANPMVLNLIDGGTIRMAIGGNNNLRTIHASVTSPGVAVIAPFGADFRNYRVKGSIQADELSVQGTPSTLRLVPNDQDWLTVGHTAINRLRLGSGTRVLLDLPPHTSAANTLRGLSTDFTPDSWAEIILEGTALLRLGCPVSGSSSPVRFANPIAAAAGASAELRWEADQPTNQRIDLAAPIVLDGDLTLARQQNSQTTRQVVGPVGWTGVGTHASNAGVVSGSGRLTFVRYSGMVASFFVLFDYATGARVEHTGGTDVINQTTSWTMGVEYINFTGDLTLGFGTGDIFVSRRARLAFRGSDNLTRTITNNITLGGPDAANQGDAPELSVQRTSANPVTVFSGVVTLDNAQVLFDSSGGGNVQQHRFDGGVALTKDVLFRTSGTNGQTLLFNSQISGAFDLALQVVSNNAHVNFSVEQAQARRYQVLSSDGGFVRLGHRLALKAATELEVLDGGRLSWLDDSGPTEFDGLLHLRPGSEITADPDTSALLSNVGPHEWSASFVTPADCRNLTVTTVTDGTTINFDSSSVVNSVPVLRAEADVTFDTTTGDVRVIRPAQSLAGDLSAGFVSTFLQLGKTMTVGEDLRLSMFKTDGQPLGTPGSGTATIAGDGVLVFTQNDGWAPPPSYDDALFDIIVAYAPAENNATLTVEGANFGKDVRTENAGSQLTMIFRDVDIAGDYYIMQPLASSAQQVVNWEGTNRIGGEFYHQAAAGLTISPDGHNNHQFRAGSETRIVGNFRPGNPKTGESGPQFLYAVNVLLAPTAVVVTEGDWLCRMFNVDPFIPLFRSPGQEPGRVVIDLTNRTTSPVINTDFADIPARVEFVNDSGDPRVFRPEGGTNYFYAYSAEVVGDDIELDFSVSDEWVTLSRLSASGQNAELRLPNTFDGGLGGVSPIMEALADAGPGFLDLRGFSDVTEGPGVPIIRVDYTSGADLWLDEQPLLLTTMAHQSADNGLIRYLDGFTVRQMTFTFGSSKTVEIHQESTVGDVLSVGDGMSDGTTVAIQPGAVLQVVGLINLRTGTSSNPTYDLALEGHVRYSPQGGDPVVVLNFGSENNPLPQPLEIVRGFSPPGSPPMYLVGLHDAPYEFPEVRLANETTVAGNGLTLILGDDTTIADFEITAGNPTDPLGVDLNGHDLLVCQLRALHQPTEWTFSGGELRFSCVSPSIEHDASSALPPIVNQQQLSLLSDVYAQSFTQADSSAVLDMGGNHLQVDDTIAIADGAVDSTGLEGATFTADFFIVSGVDMTADSAWFVNSTQQPLATGEAVLRNSDASGSPQGNAEDAEDGGGNINWFFQFEPIASIGGKLSRIGLGLGLRPFT